MSALEPLELARLADELEELAGEVRAALARAEVAEVPPLSDENDVQRVHDLAMTAATSLDAAIDALEAR